MTRHEKLTFGIQRQQKSVNDDSAGLDPAQCEAPANSPIHREGRHLDDLSEDELERLRLLNRMLTEAEAWIRKRVDQLDDYSVEVLKESEAWRCERVDQCRRDFCQADGVEQRCLGECHYTDVEVTVICVLRHDHLDFNPDNDNIMAKLKIPLWWILEDMLNDNWNEFKSQPGHRLSKEHHCWLMYDLYHHQLQYDWDAILGIDSIRIGVEWFEQRDMVFPV